ncbi:HD domain-containing protein [Methanoregula sp.]|uniref:HD domain-containing protein n=1 Tax=Methanoregula sp. TaxID=2052170 RepID=UPI0035674BDE
MPPAKWKYIKDPVHGLVKISNEDLEIISTPLFQRLRNLHHMGTAFLTYPGATHSRFEHSLGVAELGTSVFKNVICNSSGANAAIWNNPDERKKMEKTLRYACLLHDIGHTPFSHTCEGFYSHEIDEIKAKILSKLNFVTMDGESNEQVLIEKANHEIIGCYVILTEYREKLEGLGVNAESVAAMILGRVNKDVGNDLFKPYTILAQILNSPIDVDKFDYLLRDNYMTGSALISLDKERLLSTYTILDDILVLSGKALSVISNLIIGRQQVYMWVYQHHKVVYTNALLEKILKRLIEDGKIKPDFFSVKNLIDNKIDDYDVITQIRNNYDNPKIKNLYESWRERKFLKSPWKNAYDFRNKIDNEVSRSDLLTISKANPALLEQKIAETLRVDPDNVLVCWTKFVPYAEQQGLDIMIDIDGSPISAVATLRMSTEGIKKYTEVPYVYVEEEKLPEILPYLQCYRRRAH